MTIRSESGQSFIIAMLVLAAAGVIFMASVSGLTLNLEDSKRSYLLSEERSQLAHEIQIVLSNIQLCSSQFRVSPQGFSMGPNLTPNSIVSKNLKIVSMTLENQIPQASGSIQTDFVIVTQDVAHPSSTFTTTVQGLYSVSGGAIMSCGIIPSPQDACGAFGVQWNAHENRCGVCESIGGTWSLSTSKCVI